MDELYKSKKVSDKKYLRQKWNCPAGRHELEQNKTQEKERNVVFLCFVLIGNIYKLSLPVNNCCSSII